MKSVLTDKQKKWWSNVATKYFHIVNKKYKDVMEDDLFNEVEDYYKKYDELQNKKLEIVTNYFNK